MATRVGALVIAGLIATAVLGACTPPPPATPWPSPSAVVTPSPSPRPSPRPSPSPSPSPTTLSGTTTLAISGRIASYCIPPPSGCSYWVTLVLPGGETMRSRLQYAPEWDPATVTLTPGPGLPASLPWGRYALVFEFGENSDVVSFVPGPDGSPMQAPPIPEVGCTATLVIGEQPRATVVVTYDGWGCKVKISP